MSYREGPFQRAIGIHMPDETSIPKWVIVKLRQFNSIDSTSQEYGLWSGVGISRPPETVDLKYYREYVTSITFDQVDIGEIRPGEAPPPDAQIVFIVYEDNSIYPVFNDNVVLPDVWPVVMSISSAASFPGYNDWDLTGNAVTIGDDTGYRSGTPTVKAVLANNGSDPREYNINYPIPGSGDLSSFGTGFNIDAGSVTIQVPGSLSYLEHNYNYVAYKPNEQYPYRPGNSGAMVARLAYLISS